MPNRPLWAVARNCYAMAQTSDTDAEIELYGDIVERVPRDWYGNLIEGSFIVRSDFIADLNDVIAKGISHISLRIDSFGGDAGVALFIHNRLREFADGGGTLDCTIDGVAMSGGSVIMAACDTVKVHPSSLIMIHKARSLCWDYMNADEMRENAKQLDAWDNAMVKAYTRKCSASETEILHMMSKETYMTGEEAVEKGLADEMLESDTNIAASADRRSIYVGGRCIRTAAPACIGVIADTNQTEANAQASANTITPPQNGGTNEGGVHMAKNLAELQAENPTLAAQIEADVRAAIHNEGDRSVSDAVAAERQRLSEIDEIASQFDAETVREAKYGERPMTAADLAYRAAVNASRAGVGFLRDMNDDANASGAANVSSAAHPDDDGENPEADAKSAAKAYLEKKKAGVKHD